MPAPMPVPDRDEHDVRMAARGAEPDSAQALALASFSTTTGRPMRSSTCCRSGSSRQARFGANRTLARCLVDEPGRAQADGLDPVTAEQLGDRLGDHLLRCGPGWPRGWPGAASRRSGPCSSTTPAATLVPPTSTPIVRLMRRLSRGSRRFGALLPGPPAAGRRGRLPRAGPRARPLAGPLGRACPAVGRVTSAQTELAGACPCPAPALAARPVAARADSKTDIASRASTPTASPAAAICELTPGPDSRSTRAARQTGHHAHSGASSAGGAVALAHTSAGPRADAERGADLVADLAAHAAGPRADEPPLEIADRVLAGPAGLLCHVPSPLPASARFLSPFSAVSMIVFSARRFSIPGIGIRTSTASS